jgi:hypothetical protein
MKSVLLFFISMFMSIGALAGVANPLKQMSCEGDLPAFASVGGTFHLLKRENLKVFELSMKEARSLRIGARPERPHLEIKPWDTISHVDFKDNVAEGVEVKFWSDGSTWFSVTERSKSLKKTQHLYCNVITFETNSKSRATGGSSTKKVSVTKRLDKSKRNQKNGKLRKVAGTNNPKKKCKGGSNREKCPPTT